MHIFLVIGLLFVVVYQVDQFFLCYLTNCLEWPWFVALFIGIGFKSLLLLLYYAMWFYDAGHLFRNDGQDDVTDGQYSVTLGGVLEKTIEDILKNCSRDNIHELKAHFYQKKWLTEERMEEIAEEESILNNKQLLKKIISLAGRGKSKRVVLRAMQQAFIEMANDRNNCAEIAERIDNRMSVGEIIKRWAWKILEWTRQYSSKQYKKTANRAHSVYSGLIVIIKGEIGSALSPFFAYFSPAWWIGGQVINNNNINLQDKWLRANRKVSTVWSSGIKNIDCNKLPY